MGAVVVPEGSDPQGGGVFEGATDGRTGRHAEVVALEAAGGLARGATLYCTLEPCSHHGLTAPCAEALVAAGVRRVVIGTVDPDPKVAGNGLEILRSAGVEVVEVVEDVAGEEVREQLAAYLKHRTTGRPLVVLKLATTLDGRIAAADGSSRWITGPEARADAHRLRAESDAVLVGAGTIRADDPAMTARLDGQDLDQQPIRVVLGEAPAGAKAQPVLTLSGDLNEVLEDLGRRDVLQVLVEGGAAVAHDFHQQGLVDRYVIYLAPALAGGDDGRAAFSGPGAGSVGDIWRGRIWAVRTVGEDLRIDLRAVEGTS